MARILFRKKFEFILTKRLNGQQYKLYFFIKSNKKRP